MLKYKICLWLGAIVNLSMTTHCLQQRLVVLLQCVGGYSCDFLVYSLMLKRHRHTHAKADRWVCPLLFFSNVLCLYILWWHKRKPKLLLAHHSIGSRTMTGPSLHVKFRTRGRKIYLMLMPPFDLTKCCICINIQYIYIQGGYYYQLDMKRDKWGSHYMDPT